MREKLSEYAAEGAAWPLTASILDPVRLSVICNGPRQILEVITADLIAQIQPRNDGMSVAPSSWTRLDKHTVLQSEHIRVAHGMEGSLRLDTQ